MKTVIWSDAETMTKSNFVAIQGKDTAEIALAYTVENLDEQAQQDLVAKNPFVAVPVTYRGATFVGPMVRINRTGKAESAAITDTSYISFALPTTGVSATYGIVRLESVGGRNAWVAQKGNMNRQKGVIASKANPPARMRW